MTSNGWISAVRAAATSRSWDPAASFGVCIVWCFEVVRDYTEASSCLTVCDDLRGYNFKSENVGLPPMARSLHWKTS